MMAAQLRLPKSMPDSEKVLLSCVHLFKCVCPASDLLPDLVHGTCTDKVMYPARKIHSMGRLLGSWARRLCPGCYFVVTLLLQFQVSLISDFGNKAQRNCSI